MNARLPRIIVSGILGGVLVGFLIGAYVVVLTGDHVIRRDAYAHPLQYEQSQSRYGTTVLLAFMVVFAAIGPVIAAASFGSWIRHAIYGLVGGVGLVVVVTLIVAAIMNQQPFNMYKGSHRTCIDIARIYAVPVALIIGPVAGILIGRWRCWRSIVRSSGHPAKPHNKSVNPSGG